jgi:hypothetical protein
MTRWIGSLLAALALAGCLPESVDVVVLTPDSPEIEQALRAADARWEAAGVAPSRIQIGPGGAPVRLVPERGITSETRTTKRGSAYAGVRWIELNSLDSKMVLHELGHVLDIEFHPDQESPEGVEACAPGAPNRPLMCSHIGEAITEGDLAAACAAGDCSHFNPEQ